jgi:hypothetical protein
MYFGEEWTYRNSLGNLKSLQWRVSFSPIDDLNWKPYLVLLGFVSYLSFSEWLFVTDDESVL